MRSELYYIRAAAVSFAVPFVFDQLRLTGPGLFIMLLILNEQHHNQMELLLEENEEALAKSRLQPLAENAVQHGAAGASLTEITISTYESDGYVYIEVTDRAKERKNAAAVTQGDRAAADSMEEGINRGKRKSIGLDNVRSRLALQCGGTLEIEQVEGDKKSRLIIVR